MSGKTGPCRTPGAVYGTKLSESRITASVAFPCKVIRVLSESERADLIKQVHDGLVPVIEKLYSRTWKELFAGRYLTDHDGLMPHEHEEL